MATINYYLKGALSNKNLYQLNRYDKAGIKLYEDTPLQIYLKVSMVGSRLQIYTKKRVEPKYWIKEKQEINCRKLKVGCTELNSWLYDLKQAVAQKCVQLETSSKRISKSDLQKILLQFSVKESSHKTIAELMETFLFEHKTRSGNPLKIGTKKKYRVLANHLNNFCESRKMLPYIEDVSIQFFKDFEIYLRSEMGHSDNTIVKAIKGCKTFFGFLSKKKLLEPIDFSGFKSTETEGEIYTLSIEEIFNIQNTDFENKTMNNTRDIFCFQCWTGQRISDILKIRWEEIHTNKNQDKVWNFISVKGEERITVPIIEQADKILSKYKDHTFPLPIMSSQKVNDNLKIIGLRVGLTRKVRKIKYINGEMKVEYVPFYNILTTHIARKSYITNSLLLDIPERIVRSISKHKNEKSFRRYVEISEDYKDQKIREAFKF